MEDNKIVELYWERSEQAIKETSQKYGGYCKMIALNILSNHEDADECVNDTYLQTWNSIPEQRPSILSAYLAKITRNLSFNKYKQKKTQKRGGNTVSLLLSELDDCIPDTKTAAIREEGEIAKVISAFLHSIDEQSRLFFVRRYWYADSIEKIAQLFKSSESKVKSNLFRTRNKLKVYLEKEGVGLE